MMQLAILLWVNTGFNALLMFNQWRILKIEDERWKAHQKLRSEFDELLKAYERQGT